MYTTFDEGNVLDSHLFFPGVTAVFLTASSNYGIGSSALLEWLPLKSTLSGGLITVNPKLAIIAWASLSTGSGHGTFRGPVATGLITRWVISLLRTVGPTVLTVLVVYPS